MVERIEVKDVLNNGVEDDSVDLVVTSPPYNLRIEYENYSDDLPYPDYLVWVEKFLAMFYRVLKEDGRFCINVPHCISKGGIHPIESDYIQTLLKVGLKYQSTIIWYKGSIGRPIGRKSPENPFVKANSEAIIVGYKRRWRKFHKGISDLTIKEYNQFSRNLWQIAPVRRAMTKFPAAFPPNLPERCIKLFSYTKDTVYDPFSGSGTTCIVAEKLNRRWIGGDIGPKCISDSKKKMKDLIGDAWYTYDLD